MARPIRLRIARGPVLALLVTVSIVEIVWTIYLGLRLPRHYVANHWDLAWVGLDVGEIAMMLLTAWAAWRRRALFILFACVSGTLFLVDAWFDVTTARRGDVWQSGVLAVVWEVPLAIALYWLAQRAARRLSLQGGAKSDAESVVVVRGMPAAAEDDDGEVK